MILIIRPALETDQDAIERVLEAVWGEDQAARGYFKPRLETNPAFVAWIENRVVGFASVRGNGWHPTRDYVGVNVHPAFQARGIGAALFAALENALKARGKPLQTATMETQARARRFLERHGFTEIM
jgi:GNAT superfamily N-acetyltransferase